MGDNLKQKTINALKWSTVDRFGQQFLQFFIGIILARTLSRSDYGLIGSIAIFTAIAVVFVESGFSQALIRKSDATDSDYSSVFYFNLIVSILIYLLLFFIAPWIATFFRQPELIHISRILFLQIPINSFYLVPFAKLSKAMDFKNIAKANISAVFISGTTGIVLALNGFGVWSLVIQQLVFQSTRTIVYLIILKWLPALFFSFQVIHSFWKFSLNILGSSLIAVLFNNIYTIILARFYNIRQVGDFTQATKLSDPFNSSFLNILSSSSYPTFVQVQDNTDRFVNIYRGFSQKSSIIIFPVLMTLLSIAYPLITSLLSVKWITAVPYFQLIILASLFNHLYALTIYALNARGKSKESFQLEITKRTLILISIIAFFKFGIFVMLWAYAFSNLISYGISMFYLKRETNHYIRIQIKDLLKPVLIGVILVVLTYSVTFLPIVSSVLILSIQLLTAILVYVFIIKRFYNSLYTEAIKSIRKNLTLFS